MLARQLPVEKRLSPRFECDKPSVIQITRAERIFCQVKDISANGALVVLKVPMILPRHFELLIPEDLFQAECELRHHNGTRAGVMFTSRLAEAFARYSGPQLPR